MRDTKNYKPADARGKKFVERVHGKYLWYSQHGDPTFQPSLLYMSTELANPTTRTVEAAERIVGYAEKHPNRGVHYRASDMVLKIQSDASHHGLPGSRSVAGGIFYLTDKNDPPDRLNGQIAEDETGLRYCGLHAPVILKSKTHMINCKEVRPNHRKYCKVCEKRTNCYCKMCNVAVCMGESLDDAGISCFEKYITPASDFY